MIVVKDSLSFLFILVILSSSASLRGVNLIEIAVCNRCVRVRHVLGKGLNLVYSRSQTHRMVASFDSPTLVRFRKLAPCAYLESAPPIC